MYCITRHVQKRLGWWWSGENLFSFLPLQPALLHHQVLKYWGEKIDLQTDLEITKKRGAVAENVFPVMLSMRSIHFGLNTSFQKKVNMLHQICTFLFWEQLFKRDNWIWRSFITEVDFSIPVFRCYKQHMNEMQS